MQQPLKQKGRRGGFTLVELMVVLAIAAIISSITFGAFRSISEGNKRTSCQANLSQIYQATRLYAQDYNGHFPYLNPKVNATDVVAQNQPAADPTNQTPPGGLGLWALYTYPKPVNLMNGDNCGYPRNNIDLPLPESDTAAPSLTGYIKNIHIFHCPADKFSRNIDYRDKPGDTACVTTPVDSGTLQFSTPSKERRLNPAYLSYQTGDDVIDNSATANPTTPVNTYSSFRVSGPKVTSGTGANRDADRQLTYFVKDTTTNKTSTPERPAANGTVITWCRFHRVIKEDGGEITSQLNKRNYDNVLFSDGTVQSLPAQEDRNTFTACGATTSSTDCLTGWQRIPKSALPQ